MSVLRRLRSTVTDALSSVRERFGEDREHQDVDAEGVEAPTGKGSVPIERGRVLQDHDDDQNKKLLATAVREQRADQFEVPGAGQTVAEYNPEYPADDRVVEVRFFETLDAHLGEWAVEDVLRRDAERDARCGRSVLLPRKPRRASTPRRALCNLRSFLP